MSTLKLKGINKIYPNGVQAVFDFNLDIKDKEFVVFVGPSGCGKSTTLRMVAGLEEITTGELYIDNRLVNNVEPKDRDIAMVFQNYALYPHMTVYGNMAFALKLRKLPCPVYEQNEEVDALRKENIAKFKLVKKLYRYARKHNEPAETFEQINALYDEIFATEEHIKSISVQVEGIYEEKIKKLNRELARLTKEIARLEAAIAKESVKGTEEASKLVAIYQEGIAQKQLQLDAVKNEVAYLEVTPVPLFKDRKLTSYEIDLEIRKAALILDLVTYLYRKPAALSGGQRQRVALGRAIVRKPKAFLMDEPLSNLDAKLRVQTRSEIINIHKNVGATTIYVTHDQTEAMTMADRIVVMKGGYIQQIGAPETIYSDPDNIFVAGFIGNPPMNFLNATFDGKELKVGNLVIETTKAQKEMLVGHPEVVVGVRPESIVLHNDASVTKTHQLLEIGCEFRELLGHEVVIYTHVEGQKLLVKVSSLEPVKAGDALTIAINPEALYFFDKNTTNRIR